VKITKLSQVLDNVKELDPLTERELTRAIRDAIIAEEGAINQYETVADSTDYEKAKEVLQSIADEEKVHVGELQALLDEILPDESEKLEEGEDEVKTAGKNKMHKTDTTQEKEDGKDNPFNLMKSRKPPIPKTKVISPKKGKGSKYDRSKWKRGED
jgi:rubrerythrin